MARQDVGVAHQAAVRVHDGLRLCRRPGCGDHDEVIRGPHLVLGRTCQRHSRFRVRPRRRPGAVAVRPDVYPPQVRNCRRGDRGSAVGEAWHRVVDALDEIAAGDRLAHEHHLHIGVPQQPPEFPTGCESRQRNGERADSSGRQPRDEPLGAVGEQDPDPGPFADAGGQQGVGQFQRGGVRLGESQSLVVGDEELAVGLAHRLSLRSSGMLAGMPSASNPPPRAPGHQPTWTGMCE